MQIGEVIRKYRKELNLTQEEMANRLGVSAPAVNKWENGNSFPDITLLAPIARLLKITPDTLLSFRDELTTEEIWDLIREADEHLGQEPFDQAFQWVKGKLEEYPNCEPLLWQMAVMLDARRIVKEIPNSQQYDSYICGWYTRALNSSDETVRCGAADSLISFYKRQGQYDKAEEYLEYFSTQNPIRKLKQASLYEETGRIDQAYKAYEEFLFANGNLISVVLSAICSLALKEGDKETARGLLKKQYELARILETGAYQEASWQIMLAAEAQDVDLMLEAAKKLIDNLDDLTVVGSSPLYKHLTFKKLDPEAAARIKKGVVANFRNSREWEFVRNDERWQALIDRVETE